MAIFASLALLLIAGPAAAASAAAQPEPAAQEYVDTATLKSRAEALRDAVADLSVTNVSVKSRAYGFFDKLPEERLVVATGGHRRMEREPVTGKAGSIEAMTDEAARRIDQWKLTHTEPPHPDLVASVAQARALQGEKRLSYDEEDSLAQNQMGIFRYMRDSLDGGVVKLNERMRILGMLVGDAFTYATVAHEAQHARDREAGRLTPAQEIAGEVSAFKTQYLWLKLMDPSGERMLTLHGSLKIWLRRETDKNVKDALNSAVVYLEHLSDVVATNGDEDELKKLVERLGYKDGHNHEHGAGHERSRGEASPTSA